MKKKFTAFLLALIMVAQVIAPGTAWAINESRNYQKEDNKLVQVAKTNAEEYPKLTNKVILDIQKEDTENARQQIQGKKGATTFNTPYLPGQNIPDEDKPRIVGKVSADFKTKGLDGGKFDWEGVFGKDSNGNPGKAKLVFQQWLNNKETDVSYELEVSKDGTYSWKDWNGEPAKIPLYSNDLKPFTYSVYLDQDVSERVKLLTYRIAGTPSGGGFEKDPETGLNVADIVIDLSIQQVASTKFVSEWHTELKEDARPPVEGEFDNKIDDYPGYFPFSTKDGGSIIIRNDFVNNSDYEDPGYSEYDSGSLEKTPEVKVTEGIEFADENDEVGSPTYKLDEANKTITTVDGNHKFKYDFTYDVIEGGKLTMTEVIPVTFDANGGKFASITDPSAEQKIVKEVEYEGTLTDKAEDPTKERETFKGWSTTADGKTPVTDEVFKNITEKKTFYAIWDNNEITTEELTVHESFKDGDTWVNDFIPSLETLKGQVKIKDADGKLQPLAADDTIQILDDSEKPITDADLKDALYEKLKEEDATEVSRKVTLKAKVKPNGGKEQTVDIPIKVIKNIYEAKTLAEKPIYVPKDYVKVTLDPTTKAVDPQRTVYYVNPKAKVVIPGTDPTGTDGNIFTKWTMKADTATGDGADYNLPARHQFTEASTITAQYDKEKQGIIKIKYVDENGKEIKADYQSDGEDYPETKEGKLADYATEEDFPKPGPDFKGYIYSSRDSLKGKRYKDQSDPDKLDTVTYSYFKKVTTDTPKNSYVYFPVIFDANEGEFEAAPKDKKTVYVYFDGNDATVEKVTFKEVRDEFEKAYSNPTKDGFTFKEWQDKADKGSAVADNYEIQFRGWDWDADPINGYVPETFYAHYGKASALVKYLDLDGKQIADEFRIDTENYPTEKGGKAGEAIAKDVFTKNNAPKFTGYKFNRIELNPANGKYSLDKNTTIKIYYEKLPDIIPDTTPDDDSDKPEDYVTVKFLSGENGTLEGTTKYYVNPVTKKKNSDLIEPTIKANIGFKVTDKKWDTDFEADTVINKDATYTAQYTKYDDIIPRTDPNTMKPNEKPEGYLEVWFEKNSQGDVIKGQRVYYVKPGTKLGQIKKPKIIPKTGYEFTRWDQPDDYKFKDEKTVVWALYSTFDDVIPKDKPTGGENEKPKGYIKVTFSTEANGKIKGTTDTKTKVVYVNPNKAVVLKGFDPAVTPDTGYDFADWDTQITKKIQYTNGDTIKALYNEKDDVIPQEKTDGSDRPEGYLTVTFDKGNHGKLDGKTVYHVKPNKKVTVPAPTVTPETGWKQKDGNDAWDKALTQTFTEDTKITAKYDSFEDIIPGTNDSGENNPKPDGYVTVTFVKGQHGEITDGQTVYYVNPEAGKTLGDSTIVKPKVKAETGYKFTGWDTKDDFEIKDNKTVIAQYEEIADVIPKTKEDESEKPDGYITVTFSTEANGKIKGSKDTTKVVYVNPNKAVVLTPYAPEVTPDTGYDFAGWDTQIEKAIQYKDKDVIKALYNEKGDVIPQEKTDGSDKPAGYLTVIFKEGDHGTLSGKTVYYVKPNKEVTVPAPTVKPAVGYEFNNWDQGLTQTFTADNTSITAQYKELENIIPGDQTKPEGYVTVTFVAVNGALEGKTVYYVKPNVDVDLSNIADNITKKADTGYTADGGTWNPSIASKKYTADETYKFTFKALDNVIEKTEDPNQVIPEGYVKVTFKTDGNGKVDDKDEKIYYVNPKAGITLKVLGKNETATDKQLVVPKPIPAKNYEFDAWYEDIDTEIEITSERIHVAKFKLAKVTLTYDAGGAEGKVPKELEVDHGTTVRLARPDGLTKQNATFAGWKLDGEDEIYQPGDQVTLKKARTATAQWTDDKIIIPYDPQDPITRPDGYVRVTFEADTGLKLKESKAYYVKKNTGITLGNAELVKPGYKEDTGYKFDKWDKADDTPVDTDIVVIAKATKLDNVIPEKTGDTENTKPEGYKEITFVVKTGDEYKGSIEGVAKFYVNPTEYVTINPPTTKANTGYEFGTWDKDATIPTVYDKDTTITGSFNGLKDVIPKTKDDDSEKPDGYKTVTFEIEGKGGKIVDKEITVYFVNPEQEVTVPQPKTQADTGYEFNKWDQDTVTKAKKFAKDTTVKGSFKKLDDIIPGDKPKPDGYVTVTFVKGDHGTLSGQTVYYVNPKAGKTLGDSTIAKPTVKADTGNKFTGWDTEDSFQIKADKTVIAKYALIDDVIPKDKPTGGENDKPEGYITVTFDKGANGELEGNTIFYVNPKKAVVLEDKAPIIKPNTGYTSAGWDTTINKAIQYKDGDKITALYNEQDDVIPQENPDGSDKPAGYLIVTFDKGDHGELDGKTVYYVKPNKEVTVPAPNANANDGYEFSKWDKPLTQTFTKDTTITAQWGKTTTPPAPAKEYTITYKSGSDTATGTMNPVTVKENTDYTVLANGFTNDGYTFKGWKVDNSPTILQPGTVINVTANVTLTAQWEKAPTPPTPAKEYTVTYEAGSTDATGTMNPATVKENNDYTVLANGFTNDGYTFKGWKVDNGPTILQPGTVINVTANVTLTAQWEKAPTPPTPAKDYTVTYEAGSASATGTMNSVTVKENTDYTVLANGFTNNGYTFKGWKVDNGPTILQPGTVINVKSDVTLTALWEKATTPPTPAKEYTVTYKAGSDSATGTMNPVTVKENTDYTVLANGFTNEGYTFKGWKVDNGPTILQPGTVINVTTDVTLTAQWEKAPTPPTPAKEYTVTFDANGHGTAPEAQTVKAGENATEPNAPTAEGYTFAGWYTDENGEYKYNFASPVKKDIKLYAKWIKDAVTPEPKDFTIKYISTDKDHGTVSLESEIVKVDGGEIKGSEAKAKAGYKFVKWIDTEGNEVSKDVKFVPTERKDATYIAVFEKENTVIPIPTPTPEPSDPKDPTEPKDPNKPDGGRINGKDRIETAIEISKKYFGQAKTVIVVDRKDFPDAMTASVLSKLLNAPILLTDTNKLDPRVAAEIKRLGARDVIIVGGKSSVSEAVKRELAKYDKDTVERIYGKDRYETSAQVARRVVGITGKLGHAVVASGQVFADALAVAPYAAREGYPILLVKVNSLPPTVNKAIKDLLITKVTIAGGYSTVSKQLESSLPTVVERLRGNTRYETAIDIANKKFGDSKEAFLANGEQWMDALVIGPVGGMLDMPILLTGSNSAPQSLRDYIAKSNIEKITAIGGRSMVSDKVLNELSK